jgi:purine nucleoside permease
MFAFNPGVNDTSGQILGQGMVSSAQTRADAGVKMVDDIGGRWSAWRAPTAKRATKRPC